MSCVIFSLREANSLASLLSRAFSDNFFVTPQLISYPSTRTPISPPIMGVRGQTNTLSDTPSNEAHDDPIINSIKCRPGSL